MLLFYVRHGDPIYNPDSLTPLGHRQAEAVAKRLALYGVDKIYASSSTRAKQTAQPTCELLKKEMTILDWCNESHAWAEFARVEARNGILDWDFHHRNLRELYCSPEVYALGEKWYEHPALKELGFDKGEERIRRETRALLAELGYEYDAEKRMYKAVRPNEDRIALFAHQGFGLSMLSCMLDIPHPIFCTRFDMSHSGMTVVQFDTKNEYVIPCVLTMANDSHLYREGLPTNYQNRLRF
jgi:probable phosphoglycerate mutase